MIKKIIRLLVFLLLIGTDSFSQPFITEINNFKRQDSLQAPPANPILFIGSSSFTMWKDVSTYFPDHTILNRGFGGSVLTNQVYYADDVIFKYNPKQIVIYCGENDIASDKISPKELKKRYKALHKLIRNRLPAVPIAYISMKPSPIRESFLPQLKAGNKLVKKYIRRQKNTRYIDVFHAMLENDDSVKKDIFLEDRLHMNAKGYAIWQPIIAPFLIN